MFGIGRQTCRKVTKKQVTQTVDGDAADDAAAPSRKK
jgi:hypothetical protein